MKIHYEIKFRWKTLGKWALWIFGLFFFTNDGLFLAYVGATVGYYICYFRFRQILTKVIWDKNSRTFYERRIETKLVSRKELEKGNENKEDSN